MAGKIIADIIESAGSQITLNVGNVTILTASSTGLTLTPTNNVNINVANSNVTFTTANVTGAVTLSSTLKTATTIGVGNATPSASGSGITFPATQSASTDANTLDDYEEGTWTPVLNRTGTAPTISYASRNGRYTKIGNQVTIQVSIHNITVSSAGTGDNSLSGLPFAVLASTYDGGGSLGFNDAFVNTCYAAMINFNANTHLVFRAGTGRSQSFESGGWSSGGYFTLTFTYFTT